MNLQCEAPEGLSADQSNFGTDFRGEGFEIGDSPFQARKFIAFDWLYEFKVIYSSFEILCLINGFLRCVPRFFGFESSSRVSLPRRTFGPSWTRGTNWPFWPRLGH